MLKTAVITVTSQGAGLSDAMELTERLGTECGLAHKEQLRLRLLAEELVGMVRGIAGNVEALYWAEHEDKRFSLHLKSDVRLDQDTRKRLLAVSTSGENAAARGFMGKLREMIAVATLPRDAETAAALGLSVMLAGVGSPGSISAGMDSYLWTLSQFRENAGREQQDELEKSIVASLADEVRVSIVGSVVEVTIDKAF